MSRKNPFMMDFVHGIVGTYIGQERGSEPGTVVPIYVPLNSFKKIKYPIEIPEYAVMQVFGLPGTYKGSQDKYVIIHEDMHGQQPFIQKLNSKKFETMKAWRESVEDNRLELMREKARAQSASEESRKRVAVDTEIRKRRENDFGIKTFGNKQSMINRFRPGFLNDEDDDQ